MLLLVRKTSLSAQPEAGLQQCQFEHLELLVPLAPIATRCVPCSRGQSWLQPQRLSTCWESERSKAVSISIHVKSN